MSYDKKPIHTVLDVEGWVPRPPSLSYILAQPLLVCLPLALPAFSNAQIHQASKKKVPAKQTDLKKNPKPNQTAHTVTWQLIVWTVFTGLFWPAVPYSTNTRK